ncbi:MAG TPA: hypothetical protein VGT60_06955 [Candidatus Limnocylindria bacterium]|nr:hypothetical protein [Candidatus Limnocylindria bacterium]
MATDTPLVRAHVDDFDAHDLGWSMLLSGSGPLPDAVIKAIAGGPVLVTFERGCGGAVVDAPRRERLAAAVRA